MTFDLHTIIFKRTTERDEVVDDENIPTEKLLPWENRVSRCIAKKAEKIMVGNRGFYQQQQHNKKLQVGEKVMYIIITHFFYENDI